MKPGSKTLVYVYLSVFLGTVCGGAGFVFMKDALDAFSIAWFIFLRFFISVLVLFPILRKELTPTAIKPILRDAVIVGTLFFIATMIQSAGIAKIGAGKSAFINSMSVVLIPAIQAVLVWHLPSPRVMVGCILCMGGVAALSGVSPSGFSGGRGEIDVFVGTCIFACGMFFTKHAANHGNPRLFSFIMFAVIAIWSLPFAAAGDLPADVGPRAVIGVLYTALLMNIAMIMVNNHSLKYISPTSLAVMQSTMAVHGAFFGFLLRDEIITWNFVLCGLAVISGILIVLSDYGRVKLGR